MDAQLAQAVFTGIMVVAVGVWAYSLRRAARLGQRNSMATDPWAPGVAFDNQSGECEGVTGAQTIRGEPESISKALGQMLLSTGVPGMFATLFEITERSSERIAITKTGPLICNQPSGLCFSEAEFEFRRAGGNTVEVTYRLHFERLLRGVRRTALGIILGLGLPVLFVVGWVVWVFVVSSDDPAVRWQVFQTLQVVHVLWPPFLLMSVYRSGRVHARTYVSNLLRSLELVS